MFITVLDAISLLLLSQLFAVGGWQKFAAQSHFQQVISDYRIAPQSWSPLLARYLPIFEMAAGLALLVPVLRIPALASVTTLRRADDQQKTGVRLYGPEG